MKFIPWWKSINRAVFEKRGAVYTVHSAQIWTDAYPYRSESLVFWGMGPHTGLNSCWVITHPHISSSVECSSVIRAKSLQCMGGWVFHTVHLSPNASLTWEMCEKRRQNWGGEIVFDSLPVPLCSVYFSLEVLITVSKQTALMLDVQQSNFLPCCPWRFSCLACVS